MNRKFYFSLLAFALMLCATVAFVVGYSGMGAGARAASTNAALAALPSSDFVIGIDAQRGLSETLPSLLSGNPALLARMNAHLDEFQKKTGINPRSFESIAIGGRISGAKPHDSRSVVIARGSFNTDQLLEAAFASARARGERFQKEEQQYEGKRIILIHSTGNSTPEAAAKEDSTQATPAPQRSGDRLAIAVLDANTLAVGDLEGVHAAVDASMGRGRVDDELVRLATQQPDAVVGFSGRIPQSTTQKVSSNTGFEKYFASIHMFYGSFSANGTDAESNLYLRTETAEQATEIGQALNALKALSSFGFAKSGGASAAQTDSLADLLKGVSVTVANSEVQINVKIPQASVAPLMRRF